MLDVDKTVISQYSNSPVLTQLIENFNTCVDPTVDLQQFYDLIWNIDTAQGVGLDIWGRIVGIGRVLTVTSGVYLGMTGAGGASGETFNTGIFYSGQTITSNYRLTDEAYRLLILAKAAANISNGSVQSINAILMNLFPNRGNCYVTDNGNMSLTYTFQFPLQPFEVAIINTSGVLPKPAGVAAGISYPIL